MQDDSLVLSPNTSEVGGDGKEAHQPDSKDYYICGLDLLSSTRQAHRGAYPSGQLLSNCPAMTIMVVWFPLSSALPAQTSGLHHGKALLPAEIVVADTAGYSSHGVEICHHRNIPKGALNPAEVQLPATQIKVWPVSIRIGACH